MVSPTQYDILGKLILTVGVIELVRATTYSAEVTTIPELAVSLQLILSPLTSGFCATYTYAGGPVCLSDTTIPFFNQVYVGLVPPLVIFALKPTLVVEELQIVEGPETVIVWALAK
jgi:hypothetical protein